MEKKIISVYLLLICVVISPTLFAENTKLTIEDSFNWFKKRNSYYTKMRLTNLEEILLFHLLKWSKHWQVTDKDLLYLTPLKKLKKIKINGSTEVTNNGMKHLAKIECLEYLDISGTLVTDEGLRYLKNIKNLQFLILGKRMMSIHYPNLRIISINITNDGLRYLNKIEKLKYLKIQGIQSVNDEGIVFLMKLKTLKVLDLRDTKITYSGTISLSKKLKTCKILILKPEKGDFDGKIIRNGKMLNSFPSIMLNNNELGE